LAVNPERDERREARCEFVSLYFSLSQPATRFSQQIPPFMRLLDLTLPSPPENLALDEALLNDAECAALAGNESHDQFETLRIWESPEPVVVVGSSTRVAEEVKLDVCAADGVPVLRRVSGGTTIVAGPGCLMYAVVLSYRLRPALRSIDEAHRFALSAIVGALNQQLKNDSIIRAGTSDLAIGDRKFSGNALRCRRHFMLYHGTLLYNFPLALISKYQLLPSRQPDYRQQRDHDEFVMNLPLARDQIRAALGESFAAHEPLANIPQDWVQRLVAEKYTQAEWNNRL
jgi:lipoate-protein ligase A